MGVETAKTAVSQKRAKNMKNVDAKRNGNTLVLTIDISAAALAAAEASKSGKTKLVATTGGFTGEGPVKYSLNVTC